MRTAKTAPYIAPTIMWITAPSRAGPTEKKNEPPAMAFCTEAIIVFGEMNVEAMW